MPSLKSVLDTLDNVEDAVKPFYAEHDDGKFHLNLDQSIREHKDVQPLKNAHERGKERIAELTGERDSLKEKLEGIPEDFDPKKWSEFKKGGKADPDELVRLRQAIEGERDEWKGKYEDLHKQSQRMKVETSLDRALADQGVTHPPYQKAARAMLSSSVSLDEKGRVIVETDMGPKPLEEYVKRWVADEGKDFVAPPKGGGTKGGNGGGSVKKFSEMSGSEKVALHRSNPEEYERMKASG